MKNKTYKRDINKEIMFSKIMPSYNAEDDSDYSDNIDQSGSHYVNRDQEMNNPGQINHNIGRQQGEQMRSDIINNYGNVPPYGNTASVHNTNRPLNNQNNFTGYNNASDMAPFNGSASISPNGFINANIPISPVVANNVQTPASFTGANAQSGQNAVNSQASVENDEEKLINIIEYVVHERLENILTTFKCCKCDECRKAVTLKVLNQVCPEYVYMRPSEVKALISGDNYKNINQPVIRSILEIKANPPHKL